MDETPERFIVDLAASILPAPPKRKGQSGIYMNALGCWHHDRLASPHNALFQTT
jgi:hypothetical protein